LRTLLPKKLIPPIGLLMIGGPFMMFPDWLPESWRTGAVNSATVAAFVIALALLNPWKRIRPALWLFVLAVLASWANTETHDLVGLRHFAGLGAGVLAMAMVATWCTTRDRLVATSLVVTLTASAILTLGLFSTSVNPLKFTGDQADWTPKSLGWGAPFRLNLPGMHPIDVRQWLSNEKDVNPNALAGTALLVLPLCAGLAVAGSRARPRRRFALAVGGTSTLVSLVVLGVTLSRMAWLGAVLTLFVWFVHLQRRKLFRLLTALVITVAVAAGLYHWRSLTPVAVQDAIETTAHTAEVRVLIWLDALEQIRAEPWLGIGINQFHSAPSAATVTGSPQVAHAHNILIQVALDVGMVGLLGYSALFMTLVWLASRLSSVTGDIGPLVAGAGLALVAVHMFGTGDAIALGSKVGAFQWLCGGLILAAARLWPAITEPLPASRD